MPLAILAQITSLPGKESVVQAALKALIAPTLAEDGCIQYDLHTDNDMPGFFVFYEIWETRALWQAHMKSPHIIANGPATEGAIASVQINEMTKVA
ncbi:MAG: quinol monooxygenase YgiN [Paracoccaceae bacterium]|jgi:quinol monooxygenase YgiN